MLVAVPVVYNSLVFPTTDAPTFCGLCVARLYRPEEIVDLTAKVSALFALASIVGQFTLFPVVDSLSVGWVGLYGHKNFFGVGMAIGIASLLASRSKWGFSRWCMLLLFLALLILARSATAIVIVAIVAGIYAFTKLPRFARLSLPVAAAVATVLVVWTSNVDNVMKQFFDLVGRDSSFTGRDKIWHFVSVQIGDRPLLGYGYQGFWLPHEDFVIANLGWDPGHAHNGFLDIILTFGIAGLFVFLAVLWDGVRRGVRARVHWGEFAGAWLLLVMCVEFLNNLTDVDYMGPTPLWTLFIIAYFSCSVAERKRISIRGENKEGVIFLEGGLLHGD